MLTLTRAVRVFACAVSVDMRKGFDGLSALVEQQLGGQLLKGDVFLFVGRSRRRAKVLYFDGTGLVLVTQRLFRGRFARPWVEAGAHSVELTVSELSLFRGVARHRAGTKKEPNPMDGPGLTRTEGHPYCQRENRAGRRWSE